MADDITKKRSEAEEMDRYIRTYMIHTHIYICMYAVEMFIVCMLCVVRIRTELYQEEQEEMERQKERVRGILIWALDIICI